ncbi:hypothetical protein D1007_46711 [Hordeum vulgare]|nr:hypothetical protein D1007_46711 [Hordeum vulgare]
MEETNKALTDLTAAINAMSAQISEIYPADNVADIADSAPRDRATSDQEADCCVISKEALEGAESSTMVRLHGWVQGREVLMLVDSGSSHNFICESLAAKL